MQPQDKDRCGCPVSSHINDFEMVFQWLEGAALRFSGEKSVFGQREIVVAGHLSSLDEVYVLYVVRSPSGGREEGMACDWIWKERKKGREGTQVQSHGEGRGKRKKRGEILYNPNPNP